MQLHRCSGRAKAGGKLAEEKKLLSLAWREVGGGLGSLPEAGGGVDESLVLLLPVLEKEENENSGADWLLPPWRKKEELSVERVEDELVAALVGSLATEVTTVQEDEVCRGERSAGRRRKRGLRWLLGGWLASYGGVGVRGDV